MMKNIKVGDTVIFYGNISTSKGQVIDVYKKTVTFDAGDRIVSVGINDSRLNLY